MSATLDDKIAYLDKATKNLNSQLGEFNLRIVFDYTTIVINDEDLISDLDSVLLSLLDNNKTTIQHEKLEDFANLYKINDFLIEFISMIEDTVKEKIDTDSNNYLYSLTEYDAWMSSNSADFKGVFTSKIEAILALNKHYHAIAHEESREQFVSLSQDFDIENNFEKISIRLIEKNELN